MSTTATDGEKRPWHGADNPYEAIFQHFTAEIAALEKRLTAQKPAPVVAAPPAPRPSPVIPPAPEPVHKAYDPPIVAIPPVPVQPEPVLQPYVTSAGEGPGSGGVPPVEGA